MTIRIQGTTVIDNNRNATFSNVNASAVVLDTGNGEVLVTPTGWRSANRAAIKVRSKSNNPAEIDLRRTEGGREPGWHFTARGSGEAGKLDLYKFDQNNSGGPDTSGFQLRYTFNTNGSLVATGDMRAPIFYDSNNTSFYVDPASTSIMNYVRTNNLYDSAERRFVNPNGAVRTGNPASTTGAIRIRLPTNRYAVNTMMTFGVTVYEYSTGRTHQFIISGYNFSDTNWYNISAMQTTDSGRGAFTIRWGRDGTRNIVWIGETNTTWSYPQVYVTNFTAGHSGFSSNWGNGWEVDFVTSFNTVTTSRTASMVKTVNNASNWVYPDYATIFYDSNDTSYYIDPNARRSSNINGFSARTKMTLGLTAKYQLDRADYTSDINYWIGTMGWGTTDFNTINTWGSGFIDTWSSPGNRPTTAYSHFVGLQAQHYNNGATNGTGTYGFQMVMGGGTNAPLYYRTNWNSAGSWKELIDSGTNQTVGGTKTFSAGRINSPGASSHNHGAISIGGSKSGYAGIAFPDANAVFMVRNSDALSGIYKNNNTWAWYFDGNGTLITGTIPWARLSGIPATLSGTVNTTGNQTISGNKTFTGTTTINTLVVPNTQSQNFWIRNTSPTIYLRDTDHNVSMIHCNSNIFYILRGGTDATTWTSVNGVWPLEINLTNNNAQFGGDVLIAGNARAFRQNTTGTWGGNPGSGQGKIEYHSNRWYYVSGSNSSEVARWRRSSSDVMWLNNSGALSAVNNITAYASDGRLKHNIHNIENALDKLEKINGVTFDWDVDKCSQWDFDPTNTHEVGFIAQEIQSVLPEAVCAAPFDLDQDGNSKSGEDYLTVRTELVTPLLVEAIKELRVIVEKQQRVIEELQNVN